MNHHKRDVLLIINRNMILWEESVVCKLQVNSSDHCHCNAHGNSLVFYLVTNEK
jgi:hypothetical protein